ncbi:MAG TPA: haloalkane dehalogenase [Gammaproteobacteria bacterium]|jgi:haloalkane dehalogenase|nr:haloalkane dehalogenase [Gammaproteobacteria bacterium]
MIIENTKLPAFPSKYVNLDNANMHYLEAGEGDPILFLHGIPTSSYLWRHLIPHLSKLGRCIAPDLIGFGQSDKPDIEYSIYDHSRYLQKFIETLNLKNITLIMHGWGSVIGFQYAMQHEKNCKGLVFYEAFLRSLHNGDLSLPFQEQLTNLEHVHDVTLVDKLIQQAIMRPLAAEELENYRQPFMEAGAEKPILQYFKELLSEDNEPINQLIVDYSKQLAVSSLPKLLLYSVPGFITTIETVMWAKEHLPHIEIVDIGEELHLAQEVCPELMSETISVWLQGIESIKTNPSF